MQRLRGLSNIGPIWRLPGLIGQDMSLRVPPRLFTPKAIPGVQLWYDAHDLSALAVDRFGQVMSWAPSVGLVTANNTLQPTNHSPIYFANAFGPGIGGLSFGDLQSLSTSAVLSGVRNFSDAGWALFSAISIVGPPPGDGLTRYLYDIGQDSGAGVSGLSSTVRDLGGTGSWAVENEETGTGLSSLNYLTYTTDSTGFLYTKILPAGAPCSQRFNGGLVAQTANGITPGSATSHLHIGNGAVTGTTFGGKHGDLILTTGDVSPEQVARIEGYLAWKYGLQGQLPLPHPYKFYPPQ